MDKFRIDHLTAEFVYSETEQAFREYIRDAWVQDTRQAITLAAFFYLLFAVTDYLVLGLSRDYWLVLINRLLVCAVGLTVAQ